MAIYAIKGHSLLLFIIKLAKKLAFLSLHWLPARLAYDAASRVKTHFNWTHDWLSNNEAVAALGISQFNHRQTGALHLPTTTTPHDWLYGLTKKFRFKNIVSRTFIYGGCLTIFEHTKKMTLNGSLTPIVVKVLQYQCYWFTKVTWTLGFLFRLSIKYA